MSQPETTSQSKAASQGELSLFAPPANIEDMLVPARMVNEWVYCPRLAFLEWAHGEWAGNADTASGNRAHAATEAGRAPAMPPPTTCPMTASSRPGVCLSPPICSRHRSASCPVLPSSSATGAHLLTR